MKKTVLLFGSIAGAILGGMLIIGLPYMMKGNMEGGAVWGYSTMIVAFTAIFFGVKTYRDKHMGGTITFKEGFKAGILIALLASFLYALGWEIALASHGVSAMEFMDYWSECQAKQLLEDGSSPAEIAKKTQEQMANFSWYGNLFLRFLWTMLFESFIMGAIVALISALILRKKKVLPAQA